MVTCSKCNAELSVTNWSATFQQKGKQRNICKSCWSALASERTKKYRKTERGRVKAIESAARWRKEHPTYAKMYYQSKKVEHSNYHWRLLWKYKLQAFALLGDKCVHCGEADPRLLDINHKNGGGNKEGLFGFDMYKAIVKGDRSIEDLELRCCNGNRLYEYEVGRRRNPPTR